MAPKGILVIGGTRGLGAELVKHYVSGRDEPVYATTRSDTGPGGFPGTVKWLPKVDLMDQKAAEVMVSHIDASSPLSTVVSLGKNGHVSVNGELSTHARAGHLSGILQN